MGSILFVGIWKYVTSLKEWYQSGATFADAAPGDPCGRTEWVLSLAR